MTTMTESRLTDQAKLKILCDDLCDQIESVLDHFNLDYKVNGKMISMCCPIHGGDNPSAISLYPHGDTYRGNWKCRTHNCENTFKGSILGLIRGILSNKQHNWEKPGDKFCSFADAVNFATQFLNKDLSDIKISKSDRNKKTFTNIISYISNDVAQSVNNVTRESIVKSLKIPAQYYLDRGYSSDILIKYDVGLCDKPGKEMQNRIVVPIYDKEHKYMVGCSGRSIYEKCSKCSSFHNPSDNCPNPDFAWTHCKWKHNSSFKAQNHLYNFWFAKQFIMESTTAIIVESPGNVWRLEENGIHNSVAIFGSSLSDRQKILLDSSGAMNLIILTDNDDAGKKAAEQIKNKCQNTYKVFIPTISKPDVGEMSPDEIQTEIKNYIERIV